MARVSVILPVHKGAATIGRALASVFAQSFTDYEVVVVDDGSTDDTSSVLARFGARIRVVRQLKLGVSAARNAGVRADPNCVLAYTGAFRIDLNGMPMPNQESQTEGVDSPTMAQMLERPWTVVPSQFMVRRAVLERCGGFDERLTTGEDIYFLLLAREHGYFRYVPESAVRKDTRPLYPTALNREPGCELLVKLIRERYGASATGFIREFRRMRMKVMKHMARLLIEEGRPKDARRCLARLIHYQPTSPKAYRRYLKTFLPTRIPPTTSSTEDSEA